MEGWGRDLSLLLLLERTHTKFDFSLIQCRGYTGNIKQS
jgi:hypothetical protein